MTTNTITITIGGQQAETAAQAAARYGLETQNLRHILARADIKPVGRIDARTPLYLTADVDRHLWRRRQVGAEGVSTPS